MCGKRPFLDSSYAFFLQAFLHQQMACSLKDFHKKIRVEDLVTLDQCFDPKAFRKWSKHFVKVRESYIRQGWSLWGACFFCVFFFGGFYKVKFYKTKVTVLLGIPLRNEFL